MKCRLSSSLSGPERVQARWHHQLVDVLTIIHAELLVLNRVLQRVAQAVLAETRDPLPLFIFVQLTKMLVRRRPLGLPLHADGSIISDVERHHAGQNAAPVVLLWTSCRILSVTKWL